MTDRTFVALGNFDGVHLGHRAMLALADAHAHALTPAARVTAATFDPHPLAILRGEAPPLICPLDERVRLLHEGGADAVKVIPFTEELSRTSPEDFVRDWLLGRLRAAGVVVGDNFRFGHRAAGDVETLRRLGRELGFEVAVCDLMAVDAEPVSSSRIRSLIRAGGVEEAATLLGRQFALDGPVVEGARRGRELGVPTANLQLRRGLLVPGDGVYAGRAFGDDGMAWPAAISVGTNPQFLDDPDAPAPVSVEAHLLDYHMGDALYGRTLRVEFHAWLRGQRVFASVDELVQRMRDDIDRAAGLVGRLA